MKVYFHSFFNYRVPYIGTILILCNFVDSLYIYVIVTTQRLPKKHKGSQRFTKFIYFKINFESLTQLAVILRRFPINIGFHFF
jgi:hypothetical protein